VTLLDGLVLARSGFHHSMNYRSAVVIALPRLVDDPAEKVRALDLIVDNVVPGRARTLRAHSRKELAATVVLALSLHGRVVGAGARRRPVRRRRRCRGRGMGWGGAPADRRWPTRT